MKKESDGNNYNNDDKKIVKMEKQPSKRHSKICFDARYAQCCRAISFNFNVQFNREPSMYFETMTIFL